MNVEYIGYLASFLIAVSLLMKSILRLRIINLIGSLTFLTYGLFVQAYPVVVSNGAIVLIDLYYLYQMWKTRDEKFEVMVSSKEDDYFKSFMKQYATEIQLFNPSFLMPTDEDVKIMFVLRDLVPAGVVISHQEEDGIHVDLDFAIPQYRDLKVGDYVFSNKAIFSESEAPVTVYATGETKKHINYLKKTGFELVNDKTYAIVME